MSLLEQIIDKRAAEKEKADARASKLRIKMEQAKEAKDKREFHKRVREQFPRLWTLVGLKFPKFQGLTAAFKYKKTTYYLRYEKWESEPVGVDDYYRSGQHWVLRREYNHGEPQESFDASKKDMTDRIIQGVENLENRASQNSRF